MKNVWMLWLAALPLFAQTKDEPLEPSEVVVVTATKQERKLSDLPISASVVASEDLNEKAVVEAGEDLLGVPGVFMRREGSGSGALSVNIRGLTGVHGNDTFLALLDGIPFISANEEVLFSELPIGAVDRVEVVRGPVSALYGRGGLSGAVNYLTREPGVEQEISLDLRGGSYGYVRPHLSASLPLGEHRLLIDGYAERRDGWRDGTEREAANILIKDEVVFSPVSRLTAYANVYESTQGAGGQIPLGPNGEVLDVAGGRTGFLGYEPNEYDRTTIMTALRHHYLFNGQVELVATLHYRNIQDNNVLNFYDPYGFDPANDILRVNGFENDRDTDVLFFEPRVTWSLERHNLVGGLNWEQVKLKETDWWSGQNGLDPDTFDYYFYEININYRTGEIINLDHPLWARNETYRGTSTNQFTAVYLQDEWQISDRTALTLGFRYDVFERDAQIDSDVDFDGVIDRNPRLKDREQYFSPKFALNHHFNESISGYVTYGKGFNSNFGAVWQWDPSLYERGDDVPPSVVRNLEVGLKGRRAGFNYSASVFSMVQEDRLVFISNPNGFGPPKASTADEFESAGLELEAGLKLGANWLARLAYTYIDAEWKDYTVGGVDYSGNQPTGVPEQMFSLSFRGRLSDALKLWGSYNHFDDYYVTLGNDVSGGGYSLLDLGLNFALPGIGAELSLVGKNLLDEDYYTLFGSTVPYNATPGQPAHFMLNLRFDF